MVFRAWYYTRRTFIDIFFFEKLSVEFVYKYTFKNITIIFYNWLTWYLYSVHSLLKLKALNVMVSIFIKNKWISWPENILFIYQQVRNICFLFINKFNLV